MLTAASWLLNLWFGESWVLSRSRCWKKLGSKDRNAPYIIHDIVWNTVLAYQQKIIQIYIYIRIYTYIFTNIKHIKFYNKQSIKRCNKFEFFEFFRWFFRLSAELAKATRQIASSELFVPRSLTGIGLGPLCFEKKTAGAVLLAHPGNYHQMRPRNFKGKTCTIFLLMRRSSMF